MSGHSGQKREADEKVSSLPPTASANRVLCWRLLWVLMPGWCQLSLAPMAPQQPKPLVLGSCASRMSLALYMGPPDPNTLSSTPTKGRGKLEWAPSFSRHMILRSQLTSCLQKFLDPN